MQDPFLKCFVNHSLEYQPYTPHSAVWMRLYCILADVENWDCRVEITKEEFEAQLSNNNDLAATYVENFSNKAGYVILPFLIEEEETWIEFFLMIHQGDIVLTFWKKSDKEYDYL